MAIAVTMFQSTDGKLWHSALDAAKRDALINAALDAVKPLGKRPAFKQTVGYVQHKGEAVKKAKDAILDLARIEYQWWGFWDKPNDEIHMHGMIGRYFSDGDSSCPLGNAWHRLQCIDEQWREWQQPYFAHNAPQSYDRVEPMEPNMEAA